VRPSPFYRHVHVACALLIARLFFVASTDLGIGSFVNDLSVIVLFVMRIEHLT
jgi:hypothetical protein